LLVVVSVDERRQEPAKRQRRWNSDKSTGASADVTSAPPVITSDTKETESTQAPVTPSATSTPKASAASTSFDKPASSRPVLSRTDIAVNGDADKKLAGGSYKLQLSVVL
jgi:hypothetical protein